MKQGTSFLTMPAQYDTVNREDMTHVDGGYLQHIQLKQTRSFLNRSSCQYQAQWVRNRYHWNNIFLNSFYNSAKVIDLENGLDTRHNYFSIIWALG